MSYMVAADSEFKHPQADLYSFIEALCPTFHEGRLGALSALLCPGTGDHTHLPMISVSCNGLWGKEAQLLCLSLSPLAWWLVLGRLLGKPQEI